MCTENHVSDLKNVYKRAKHAFAFTSLNQKDSPWRENALTLVNKKFETYPSVNNVILTEFRDKKEPITIDFFSSNW